MAIASFRARPGWQTAAVSQPEFRAAFDRLGRSLKADAQTIVPVDTGRLHDSIDYRLETGRELELYLYADTEYALYVELGTRRTPAQPYLRPALERAGARFV